MVALHTGIAIALVVLLIIRFRVDPMISLVISSFYLGLAAGVGPAATLTAITTGFGEIMIKVGLLIGFGVLIGSLLHAAGTFKRLVEALVGLVGERRLPYAMTGALSAIFPSIYVDVQVVLASPIARSAAPLIGRNGLGQMAGAIGIGIFAGYVFVIPGLAAVSIAGLLGIPLGTWLLYGLLLGPLTALVTTLVFSLMLRRGYWNVERDEDPDNDLREEEDEDAANVAHVPRARGQVPLLVGLLPILVPLVMIAFGAFATTFAFGNDVTDFLGNANVALFVGLLIAYLITRNTVGTGRTDEALSTGFHTSGEILLITGVGGSLGAVIEATGLGDILGSLFAADRGASVIATVVLAWFVAVVLHLSIGSVSVAAITAGGIIAPVLTSIDVSPIAIGLAVAAGSLFAVHVNSNFFWMFKSLLGLSTRGALKSLTTVTVMGSVIALPPVVLLALVA